jgi:hypothetical protein
MHSGRGILAGFMNKYRLDYQCIEDFPSDEVNSNVDPRIQIRIQPGPRLIGV